MCERHQSIRQRALSHIHWMLIQAGENFKKTRMHRAMDSDDLGLSPDRTPEMFEFPIEIARQHDVVTLYLELMDNVLSVKSCECYFRR